MNHSQKVVEVSVIVPFYNGNIYMEKLLRCLQKNAEQINSHKIEVLVINDSPDCEVIIDVNWCPDVSLKIETNSRNLGIHQSRINGILKSTGRYILMLDQDDLITENAIASQLEKIGDGDIIVANGMDENPNNPGVIYHSFLHQKAVLNRKNYFAIGTQIVSPGQCLIKRSAIPDLWLKHSVDVNGADDLFLWLLMLNHQIKWSLNYEVLYCHHNTGQNVSRDFEQMQKSVQDVMFALKSLDNISVKEEKICFRRFQMRQMYEGKGSFRKLAAYICYPDIAFRILLARFGR